MSSKTKFKHLTVFAGLGVLVAVILFRYDIIMAAIFAGATIVSSIFAVCNYIDDATDDIIKKIKS